MSNGDGPGFIALQRAALEELLGLSRAAVAPLESEIEERYRQARASAETVLQKTVAEVEARAQEKLGSAEHTHAELIAKLEAEAGAARAALAAEIRTALERIAANSN